MPKPLTFNDVRVTAGQRAQVELPVARLPTGGWMSLQMVVLHGKRKGPAIWLDGVLHGDELIGLEIIHRVLAKLDPAKLSGTVIAVPIVNVFGVIQQSRYLPDRRDLNRSFPGSRRGPLASRLANIFMHEVVERCQYGIDFHTGSLQRENLPQIRADLDDPRTRQLAEAFAAPVMFHSKQRPGSLRSMAHKLGVPLLVYEGGEPLRFTESAVRAGVDGTLRVLSALGIWKGRRKKAPPSRELRSSSWIRAGHGGILRLETELGARVARNATLGRVVDPLSGEESRVRATRAGVVIGRTHSPLVYQGDALVHVAQ